MKYLLLVVLITMSGCSFISKKAEITSIEKVQGNSCEDIKIRKTVLVDTIAVGPPLLPIVPAILVKLPAFDLTVVDCINNVRYPVKKEYSEYYWLNTLNNCKYKIEVSNEYEYVPFWWDAESVEPMSCYSFTELNKKTD